MSEYALQAEKKGKRNEKKKKGEEQKANLRNTSGPQ
jgi:hypothetical protein